MASKSAFIFVAIAFLSIVSAKDFMVGDDKGWTINFDYQAWAQDKEFYVGDKLGTFIFFSTSVCKCFFYTITTFTHICRIYVWSLES